MRIRRGGSILYFLLLFVLSFHFLVVGQEALPVVLRGTIVTPDEVTLAALSPSGPKEFQPWGDWWHGDLLGSRSHAQAAPYGKTREHRGL